jgi:hypothetical protein
MKQSQSANNVIDQMKQFVSQSGESRYKVNDYLFKTKFEKFNIFKRRNSCLYSYIHKIMWYRLILIAFILLSLVDSLKQAADGSVCFDNCNGHGDCVDYSCVCHVGYHGDDCSETYALDESNIIPILGSGHFNVTKKDFPSLVKKSPMLLVGFSSKNCHRCIQAEYSYKNISDYLYTVNIPFARADADEMKSIALDYESQDVPSLVFFKKGRHIPYRGYHDSAAVIQYIQKQLHPPVTILQSVDTVEAFLSSFHNNASLPMTTVAVIGFFSSHQDIEEDEYEDYLQLAKDMQGKADVYFGLVHNKLVSNSYKKLGWIDRTPSILLQRDNITRFSINIDEFIGEDYGLKEWIERKSVSLVSQLTHSNFHLYEKLGLPMLILFLDLSHHDRIVISSESSRNIVGGKSGDILNEVLLDEYRRIAIEYQDKISFVYADGITYQDQMRALGIYGGAEGLPSLGFNTKDGRQVPFPNDLPINYDTLNRYCAEFLSGKMRTPKDSLDFVRKYELQSVLPINQKNKATRKPPKQAPETTTGVAEQFGDELPGANAVVEITSENWDEIAMAEDKDVAIVFHAHGCESCAHFAVYYKRMAKRFHELNIPSLVIGRMNVTNDSPPAELGIITSKLPLFILLPAGAKHPPWSYYSGISKIQQMMKWVQQQAAIKFDLPHLPHLNEEQVKLYKEQIREREEYMENKRKKEDEEMEAEDRERHEVEERRKKLKLDANERRINAMIDESDLEL